MILLCAGEKSEKDFDALLLFAVQLQSCGYQVGIDARFMPEETKRHQKYEVAPFLTETSDLEPSTILVIGAETISDEVQSLLRSLDTDATVPVWAVGYFADQQSEIGARNKIAYCIGREPRVYNLSKLQKRPLLDGAVAPMVTEIAQEPRQSDDQIAQVIVYMTVELLEEPGVLSDIIALGHTRGVDLHVLTTGVGKELIRRSGNASLSVFSYGELPPALLVGYADVVAFFGTNVPGERMAHFVLDAMAAGKVVIDCTSASAFVATGAPVLHGPDDIRAMANYLGSVVLDQRHEIGRRIQTSEWLRDFDIKGLEQALDLERPPQDDPQQARTIFFPTNGNGLGHAQRCALIGEAMGPDNPVGFVAFPSCTGMLEQRGFPCAPMVSRSPDHPEEYANDLVNYLRLLGVMTRQDQLVFDGGFVFDSVYRAISALQIPSVWIRRGLWQPGQVNPTALERERVFSKVIVPTEAFVEINAAYSNGTNVHLVGPVVNASSISDTDRKSLRKKLAKRFDRPVKTLVVSMLGGGVASERTAQTQMLCSLLERRSDCLHLVVAWPNAVVASGLYGWANTQVVYTRNAIDLCQAADLTVSASGYNSFHEILYGQIPAILIPQSAPFLDDQEKRANAAAERGLVSLVRDTEMLVLEQEVSAFLDGDKASELRSALSKVQLPQPGNQAAADLIAKGLRHDN